MDQDKIQIKDIDIKAEYTNVSSVLSHPATLRDKDLFEVIKFTVKLEAVHKYIWDVYHKPSEIRKNFEDIISELEKNNINPDIVFHGVASFAFWGAAFCSPSSSFRGNSSAAAAITSSTEKPEAETNIA